MSHGTEATIFLTGATGYVGGRLAPRLLQRGYRVRALSRSTRKLESRPWARHPNVEIVEGDAGDLETLTEQMRGCRYAYYLVHSMMAAGADYRQRDLQLASLFGEAARRAGVERIIYLGGLGETGDGLSRHLASRREVETALRCCGVPVTTLRAAMIIGSGSASFEILRYLVERLPIMVTPRWVSTEVQPIAIRNVLHYLIACIETPETTGRILDIGGPEVLTYRDLMRIMATERDLKPRFVLPVPVLTPKLSSLWIHLVTPLSHRIARPLAEGLRNRVICQNDETTRLMPQRLMPAQEAIAAAIGRLESHTVETSWADAGPMPGDPDWSGGAVFQDERRQEVLAPASAVFETVCRIGGRRGYFGVEWLWSIRGWIDRLVGGPGLRRGRRNQERLGYGDPIDFWRVTGLQRDEWLELRAEMRLPGVATLAFRIEPDGYGRSTLTQTAKFRPKGLLGLLYWHAVTPLHNLVFRRMLKGITRSAEQAHRTTEHAAPTPVGSAA